MKKNYRLKILYEPTFTDVPKTNGFHAIYCSYRFAFFAKRFINAVLKRGFWAFYGKTKRLIPPHRIVAIVLEERSLKK